jgi:hypothetical protein
MDRKTVFSIALLYLAVMLLLGLVFFVKRDLLWFVPSAFGPVPVGVPWFGALGAILISLTGVFEHEHDWDSSYWPWHLSRPLIGVALGVVSVLILQAGVLAIGSTPTQPESPQGQASTPAVPQTTPAASASPSESKPVSPAKVPTYLLYYLVAFLVGYREETFRELIKRLVDIILSPGTKATPHPTIHAVNPAQAPHGTSTEVVVTGTGFTGAQSVKFGSSAAQPIKVKTDSELSATTPVVSAGGAVTLTVTTKGGSASIPFTFS